MDLRDDQYEESDPFNRERYRELCTEAAERGIEVTGMDEMEIIRALERHREEADSLQ